MARSHQIGYEKEILVRDYLDLVRNGASGAAIGMTDLHSKDNLLRVEVKGGKQIPKLVIHAMEQATKNIDADNQIPISVMVPKGVGKAKIGEEGLAILRLQDLKRLLEESNHSVNRPQTITVNMGTGEVFTFT